MFRGGSTGGGGAVEHEPMTTLGSLTTNLVALAVFVAVVFAALKIAQSIFGTGSTKATATEAAARLVAYPTGSTGVLRRRFVRALTSQHVVMPSGERLAFSELSVRISPEDLERLDPDGDTERLGEDAARLYLTHAKREGWKLPDEVGVTVEVDPGLRSGWIPPARGMRSAEARRPLESLAPTSTAPANRASETSDDEDPADAPSWDDLFGTGASTQPPTPLRSATDTAGPHPSVVRRPGPQPFAAEPVTPAAHRDLSSTSAPHHPSQQTMAFPVLVPTDAPPTVTVASDLLLHRHGATVVVPRSGVTTLGRLPGSPLAFEEPEVSYRHAALRLAGTTWEVMDLGSTNGTTLDGERLGDTWTPVREGAVLGLAGVRVTVGTDPHGTVALGGATRAQ